MKRPLGLFIGSGLVVLCVVVFFLNNCAQKRKEIPSDTQLLLTSLISRYQFGHVLLGDKPVACAGYFPVAPVWNLLLGRYGPPLGKWWRTAPLRSIDEDLLIFEELSPGDLGAREIVLIRKSTFIREVNKHRDIFEESLGRPVDPHQMLDAVAAGKSFSRDILQGDDLLMGILFGYGEHNSKLFVRWRLLADGPKPPLCYPEPFPGFSSTDDEEDWLDQTLKSFVIPGDELFYAGQVRMVADWGNPSTHQLHEHYRQCQVELAKVLPEELPNFCLQYFDYRPPSHSAKH